ncbi:MAG: hypothetical protein ABIR54_06945 [Burkholderiaceae bacterium]
MISFARNPSDLVYRLPLTTRVAGAAFAVAVLAFLLFMWPQVVGLDLPSPALLAAAALWLMMISGCAWMALSVRIAFIFGVDSVVSREGWRARAMAYADMAGFTVVHEEQAKGRGPVVRGYRVTFEAMRPGTPPLGLFVQDGRPLDAAIVRRLKTVPGLSRRQLKLLELASADYRPGQGMAQTPAGEV